MNARPRNFYLPPRVPRNYYKAERVTMLIEGDENILTRLAMLNDEWLKLARVGRLEEAWRLSDEACALRSRVDCSSWPRHQQFIWSGEDVRGRRVLVRCYHGLGDTIQFSRFIPLLKAQAAHVTLWAQPALLPILATLRNGADTLLPLHGGVPDTEYEIDVELAELMHVYRVVDATLSTESPYLHALEATLESRPARRIGIVWRAGDWNNSRSISPELLRPLIQIKGVDWILMQRGPALKEWSNKFGAAPVISDILDEARVLKSLDLLITVDTCSAHLAGALGVPVWTLLPFDADWRWRDRGETTPWYPTMRLFRQARSGDWESVIAAVMERLELRPPWA